MKVITLGKTRKGTLDFNLKSDNEFGFKVQCEDVEGVVIFNNIQSIEWMAGGRIVYLDPQPLKTKDQYNFTKYEVVNIKKAYKIAEDSLEHHYFKD